MKDLKLGMQMGYWGAGPDPRMVSVAQEAERLGYDAIFTAEAWGSDVFTPLSWIGAHTNRIRLGTAVAQLSARTPTATAMAALTLDHLSKGRMILGLGVSGPQVVEGWHGNAYGKPITRVKEYISIIRQVLRREGPLTHEGPHYQIPFMGEGSTGLGKPLKSILHGNPGLPIYSASITHAGVKAAAEVADGFFPVWMNPNRFDIFEDDLNTGFAAAGNGKTLKDFDIAPFVRVCMGDDIDECRMMIKQHLALYIGGMGARNKNFYNDYAKRLGFEDAAIKVQDFYLAGKKAEAANEVPDELVDQCSLVGPAGHIREQLGDWKAADKRGEVGTMIFTLSKPEEGVLLAKELL